MHPMQQRQLLILIPAVVVAWLLESVLWFAFARVLGSGMRQPFRIVVLVVSLAPIVAQVFSSSLPEWLANKAHDYFYYHLLFLFFFLLASLAITGLAMLLQRNGIIALSDPSWVRPSLVIISMICTGLVLSYGMRNAAYPSVRSYSFHIAKPATQTNMRVIAISDIHWDTLADPVVIERAVELINTRSPDVVLILGDSVTNDSSRFINEKAPQLLGQIQATYGTYVITGNHDFYDGKVEELMQAYKQAGMIILRDETTKVADSLWLVGREDYGGMRGLVVHPRAELTELLALTNQSEPVLVLDHQPRNLDANSALGFDIELSGHTHGGQIWPITALASRLYDLNHGLKTIGSTHFIVTCGIGYWGPPLRLGTTSEVLELNLTFDPLP